MMMSGGGGRGEAGGAVVMWERAKAGDLATIEREIKADKLKGIDKTDDRGRSALWWACTNQHLDIATLLVNAGADVNATDSDGCAPLLCTAGLSDAAAADALGALLLDADANPEHADAQGRTALYRAAGTGKRELTARLLRAVHDPMARTALLECRTLQGLSPLVIAVTMGQHETVQLLESEGATCRADNTWLQSVDDVVAWFRYLSWWPERFTAATEAVLRAESVDGETFLALKSMATVDAVLHITEHFGANHAGLGPASWFRLIRRQRALQKQASERGCDHGIPRAAKALKNGPPPVTLYKPAPSKKLPGLSDALGEQKGKGAFLGQKAKDSWQSAWTWKGRNATRGAAQPAPEKARSQHNRRQSQMLLNNQQEQKPPANSGRRGSDARRTSQAGTLSLRKNDDDDASNFMRRASTLSQDAIAQARQPKALDTIGANQEDEDDDEDDEEEEQSMASGGSKSSRTDDPAAASARLRRESKMIQSAPRASRQSQLLSVLNENDAGADDAQSSGGAAEVNKKPAQQNKWNRPKPRKSADSKPDSKGGYKRRRGSVMSQSSPILENGKQLDEGDRRSADSVETCPDDASDHAEAGSKTVPETGPTDDEARGSLDDRLPGENKSAAHTRMQKMLDEEAALGNALVQLDLAHVKIDTSGLDIGDGPSSTARRRSVLKETKMPSAQPPRVALDELLLRPPGCALGFQIDIKGCRGALKECDARLGAAMLEVEAALQHVPVPREARRALKETRETMPPFVKRHAVLRAQMASVRDAGVSSEGEKPLKLPLACAALAAEVLILDASLDALQVRIDLATKRYGVLHT